MVKLSPTQTTGSNALPALTTRKQNDFFNTVAHYRVEWCRVDWNSMANEDDEMLKNAADFMLGTWSFCC